MWARAKGCKGVKMPHFNQRGDENININPLHILWAILLVAVLSGAVTFFMLLSIAWTHKPISIREFIKLCVAEIRTETKRLLERDSGSGKERKSL